jgi:poly(beta-D-mannuronate) lyase
MLKRRLFACLCCLLIVAVAQAQFKISDLPSMVSKAKPGDTIRIPDGEYANAQLVLTGKGEAGKPIVIMATTPGEVLLTKNSYLKLGGEYLEVNGLRFTDGFAAQGAVIEFRKNNDQLANHCRVTQCSIDNYSKPERFNTDSWIVFWGKHNRIDHCTIGDKLNGGTTLIVNLDDERSQDNFHSIDSNYFNGHSRLGSNGGETIRVGVSRYSLTSSQTQIHHNLFERCNGEVEIISIKSGDNVISRNTFYECEGGLVLRHGSKNIIEGNIFIGNNKLYTGGVRVINPGHKVYNNLFLDLAGERFRSAFSVLNGVPNSALNRYYQVKDAEIHHNTFINSKSIVFGAGKDAERTLPPENVSFHHNYIYTTGKQLFEDANKNGGVKFTSNVFSGSAKAEIGFTKQNTLNYYDRKFRSHSFRIPTNKTSGADVASLDWIDADHAGASWFTKPIYGETPGTVYKISSEQVRDIQKAIASFDREGVIELQPGLYRLTEPINIDKDITFIVANGKKAEFVNTSEKSLAAFFIIQNGGSLNVNDLRFNSACESYGDVQSAISTTTKAMNKHYSLRVNNCEFYNFGESGFSCIKGTKSTYADEVLVMNSIFRNNSGTAIDFSAEKEDKGIYNVEVLKVENCVFANLLSTAINVYRGGNDESTTGPTVMIDQCTFSEVDNREQGCVVKLLGVQTASITNSIFNQSGAGGRVIWFEEMSWDDLKVDYCNFFKSGRVGSFYNKVLGTHTYNLQPVFINKTAFDFKLRPNSPLINKSSKGKHLGANL